MEVGTGGVVGGTGVGGEAGYSAPNGARDNGRVGGFGRVNMAFGSRTRLRFTFVWSDSPSEKPSKAVLSLMEFNLNDIGVNGLDESEVSHPRCNGMVMMEKASAFQYKFPAESTRVIVHKNDTQTWFISQANGPTPTDDASGEQLKKQHANEVTLVFTKPTSSFELEFAFGEPKYVQQDATSPFTIDFEACGAAGAGHDSFFSAKTAYPPCPKDCYGQGWRDSGAIRLGLGLG